MYFEIYCILTFLTFKLFSGYTHKPMQRCWGAATGRALCPPWWVKLSPLGLASTQMRLVSRLQIGTFIPSAGFCQWTGRHRLRFDRTKSTPPSRVEGQKAKGLKDTHCSGLTKPNPILRSWLLRLYSVSDVFYRCFSANRTLDLQFGQSRRVTGWNNERSCVADIKKLSTHRDLIIFRHIYASTVADKNNSIYMKIII